MQFAEVTRLLLKHGADANAASADGATPLHVAAQTHNAELVGLLIAAKADVNAVHRPRSLIAQTPLVYAAASADVDVVRALLDAGADPAKVPEESQGFIINAAMADMEVFRLLLDRGMKLPEGAMKTAARNGNAEAAAEIVRRGKAADLDAALFVAAKKSRERQTPEQEAERTATVKILLKAGASPSAPDGTGEAIVEAMVQEHAGTAELLRERGGKVDWARLKVHHPYKLAYFAAMENRPDRLREFEKLGMPLDTLGAAMLGRAERLRELITTGQANVAGERGSTALYFAAAYGNIDCVRVLLDAKTDPNARLPSWDTPDIGPRPLEGAAERGHEAVVRLLLERGADPKLIELSDEEWTKVRPEIRALLRSATTAPRR
jgi:ankyrin repeat protein